MDHNPTEWLLLRKITDNDVDAMFSIRSLPEVASKIYQPI